MSIETFDFKREGEDLEEGEDKNKRIEKIAEELKEENIIYRYISDELAKRQPEIALGKISRKDVEKEGYNNYKEALGKFLHEELKKMPEVETEEEYKEQFSQALESAEKQFRKSFLMRMQSEGRDINSLIR